MTKTKIDPKRLERLFGTDFHFRSGQGSGINGQVDACIMQAVDWLAGGDGKTDHPACAAPMVADYCIRLNDSALFAKHRDLLKPYAPKIVGTRNAKLDRRRAYIAADYACRVFTPIWLRADPKKRFDEWAAKLEALAPVTNKATAKSAEELSREVQNAANAANAAYAANAAANAAYAANAAAYAANAAANAAYAAAYAANAAAIGDKLRAKSLECLGALIAAQPPTL